MYAIMYVKMLLGTPKNVQQDSLCAMTQARVSIIKILHLQINRYKRGSDKQKSFLMIFFYFRL